MVNPPVYGKLFVLVLEPYVSGVVEEEEEPWEKE
jgi:hypothetical protein